MNVINLQKNVFIFFILFISSYYFLEYVFAIQLTYFVYFFSFALFLFSALSLKKTKVINFYWGVLFCTIACFVFVWEALMSHKNNYVTYLHQISNIILYLLGFSLFVKFKKVDLINYYNNQIISFLLCFSIIVIISSYNLLDNIIGVRLGALSEQNPNGIAYSCSLTLIILNSFGKVHKNKIKKTIMYLAQIILLLLVFFSGSRAGLMCLILVLVLLNFISENKKRLLIFKILTTFFLGFYVLNMVAETYDLLQFERFYNLFSTEQNDLSVNSRLTHYHDIALNWEKYFFFGKQNYEFYPHNIFLEFYFRYGVFLGIVLAIPFLISIKTIFLIIKHLKSEILLLIIALFLFSIIYSLFSLDLNLNKMIWITSGALNALYFKKTLYEKINS